MLRRMARRAVAGTVVALALALLVPATGTAGTYSVWSCTGPDGTGSPTDAWRAEGGALYSNPVDNCATGGGLFAHINGDFDHPANTTLMIWRFAAPENTSIAGYRIWRSAQVGPTSYNATPVFWIAWPQPGFISANVKEPHCAGHECSALGDPARPFGAGNLVTATGMSGIKDLYFVAACGGTTGFICRAADSPPGRDAVNFRIHGTDITMRDDLDPELSAPSGTLIEPGRKLAGVHGVSVAAKDEGSGLYDILLEVDGQVVASAPVSTNSGRCVKPFRTVVPCKLSATATASLDTATLPDGAHALRVIVRDATESNQAVYGPLQIVTANATNRCGGPGGTVSARYAGRKRRSVTVPFGRRRAVRGRVVDATGRPVGGAVLRVLSTIRRRGEGTRALSRSVTADPEGFFRYRTPKGPSRTLRFGWRASPTASRLTCSRNLRLKVRAAARLRAMDPTLAAGGRVRLRGSLRGGYVPKRGKVVDLQAFDDGRWRTFATVRSRGRRFKASYRFSGGARGTFPMRARVRPDGAYPFALGYSPTVRIRVG
jgi:hypothetical protein